MDSPFDYSSPVTGQHFIGRKEDCVLLGSILERSVNAAIWEPTLSGKKSLIQQTLIMLRAKGLRMQTGNLSTNMNPSWLNSSEELISFSIATYSRSQMRFFRQPPR